MTQFEEQCRARVDQLRSAFVELYDSMGADPSSPQEVSRTLRVNKTLAWNVARLLQAADSLNAVAHVPGDSSLEKVIQASVRRGADAGVVSKARAAVADFRKMIDAHAGDRGTLDLIIDGTRLSKGPLELSRKLAFRGNSGLYGVQARTRVVCNFLAPNADDPNSLDMATVSGYVGFRRLRTSVRWPIFMVRAWSQDRHDAIVQPDGWEPLEPSEEAATGFPVMRTFTRGNVPDIAAVRTNENGRDFILGEGPVGNEGAFDCFWGDLLRRAVSRYAERADEIGEFGAVITAPAERLVMDIIADKSLDFVFKPQLHVFGRVFSHGQPTGTVDDPSVIPIRQETIELSGSPPRMNTPLVPKYPLMVQSVYDRMGWNGEDFRGIRLEMDFPPLGANVILRFALPTRPG